MSLSSHTPILPPLRLAMLSVHTSPGASLGGKKTGGMNVYVRRVAHEMARRGIQVDIFTRVESPDQVGQILSPTKHVRLIHLPCGPPTPLPPEEIYLHLNEFRDALIDFAEEGSDTTYDAIYSHYWLSGWVAVQVRKRWHIPVAQMFHTLGRMKNRIAFPPRPDMEDVRVRGETEIMQHVDRIIAATLAERSQLLLLYRADRRKIDVIPPGVDLQHFSPGDKTAAKAALNWQTDCHYLLFVGRVEPLKGIDNIFEALAEIRQTLPTLADKLRLCIIGGDPDPDTGGEEMQRLLILRDLLSLGDIVHFAGAQQQSDLPNYYRAAEALIMPSDYESFGMVALEAMASGTPVIASEVGGLAFLVEDGVTGYHVPVREPTVLAERIMQLLTQPEQHAQMRQAAVDLAQGYGWSIIVDQLLMSFTMWGARPRVYRLDPDD